MSRGNATANRINMDSIIVVWESPLHQRTTKLLGNFRDGLSQSPFVPEVIHNKTKTTTGIGFKYKGRGYRFIGDKFLSLWKSVTFLGVPFHQSVLYCFSWIFRCLRKCHQSMGGTISSWITSLLPSLSTRGYHFISLVQSVAFLFILYQFKSARPKPLGLQFLNHVSA